MTRVDAFSPAAAHGAGLFETILVVRGQPVLYEEHVARLLSSCDALDFARPDVARLRGHVLRQLAPLARRREIALRIAWLATTDDPAKSSSWTVATSIGPLPRGTIGRRRHGRAIVLPREHARALPRHKTTSYLPSIVALHAARAAGADEALFVDARGRILEGATTNVFAVDGRRLITPPVSAGLLPGIMRGWVIANAPRLGLRVVERLLTREMLLKGSFMTGSLTNIAPIRILDGKSCGDVEAIVRPLQDLFALECRGPAIVH
jgi:branched-chain amino acid aminotransferase